MVWRDLIDETNGEQQEYLNVYKLIETQASGHENMRVLRENSRLHSSRL